MKKIQRITVAWPEGYPFPKVGDKVTLNFDGTEHGRVAALHEDDSSIEIDVTDPLLWRAIMSVPDFPEQRG